MNSFEKSVEKKLEQQPGISDGSVSPNKENGGYGKAHDDVAVSDQDALDIVDEQQQKIEGGIKDLPIDGPEAFNNSVEKRMARLASNDARSMYHEMISAFTNGDNAKAKELAEKIKSIGGLDASRMKDVEHVLQRLK